MNLVIFKKMLRCACLLVCWGFAFSFSSPAASWFFNPAATGANNGVDWNNAYTNLSSIGGTPMTGGDAVYLAGGTYNCNGSIACSITSSGVSNNPISILRVRATDTAATSAAGWNPAFDSQVIITNIYFGFYCNGGSGVGNYITIDGRVDTGILIYVPDAADGTERAAFRFRTGNLGNVLTNLEVAGPSGPAGYPFLGVVRGIDASIVAGDPLGMQYFTWSHLKIHGTVDQIYTGGCYNGVIEHCQLYDNFALTATNGIVQHYNQLITTYSSGITFRYNNLWNWGTEGIMFIGAGPQANWKIHNNLWHDPVPGGTARVLESQNATNGPILFFNNTMVGTWIPVRTTSGGAWSSDSQGRNNIYWRCQGGPRLPDEANNLSSSAFPFVSASDFHLAAGSPAIGAGATLAAEYAVDFDGNPRTPPWDIGAYASTNQPPVHSVIAPPGNLRLAGP